MLNFCDFIQVYVFTTSHHQLLSLFFFFFFFFSEIPDFELNIVFVISWQSQDY